jgi:hypothetical protein
VILAAIFLLWLTTEIWKGRHWARMVAESWDRHADQCSGLGELAIDPHWSRSARYAREKAARIRRRWWLT